jgi:hypothetical protein
MYTINIENAVNTINKLAEQSGTSKVVNGRQEFDDAEFPKIDQKAVILEYLENAYSGAKMMNDVEMMCRLSRAILAFDYDDLAKSPTWDEMMTSYMEK